MKPLRLRAVAFGPFGSEIEVDFERIADLGLFVVSGDTGAGKTSIFDAMFYALYGTLPGDRYKDQHVRSDHASPDAECTVALEFLSGGVIWRATRQPTQVRAKRRGDGTTEVKATAQLERFDGTDWHPISAGVIDVDRQLQPIIGLSAAQFERVVLLPQGKFRRVLDASSAEREKLLRTLFGSELFDAATQQLRESARELREDMRDQAADHQRSLAQIASKLDEADQRLAHRNDSTDSNDGNDGNDGQRDVGDREADRPRRQTVGGDATVLVLPVAANAEQSSAAGAATGAAPTLARLKQRSAAIMAGPLRELAAALVTASDHASADAQQLAMARTQVDLLGQRDQLHGEQQRLASSAAAIEDQRLRSTEAQRVAAFATAFHRQTQLASKCEELDQQAVLAATRSIDTAHAAGVGTPSAATLGPRGALGPEDLEQLLVALHQREQEVESCRNDVAHARRLTNQIEELEHRLAGSRSELNGCQSVIDEWEADRDSIDQERELLAARAAESTQRDAEVAELVAIMTRRSEYDDALRNLESATTAQQVLLGQAATLIAQCEATIEPIEQGVAAGLAEVELKQELADALGLVQAKHDLDVGMQTVVECERSAEIAADDATALFTRFLDDAAPRLAAELVDGEPCPVCGSCEHPEHAGTSAEFRAAPGAAAGAGSAAESGAGSGAGPGAITATAISEAQDRAAAMQRRLSDARASVAQLLDYKPGIGESTAADLISAVDSVQRRLDEQVKVAAGGQRARRKQARLTAELEELQTALDRCNQEVQGLQGSCDRLAGSLGGHVDVEMTELAVQHGATVRLAQEAVEARKKLDALARLRREREQGAADATRRVDDLRSEVSAVQAECTTERGLHELAVAKVESIMKGADPALVGVEIEAAVNAAHVAQRALADATVAKSHFAEASQLAESELLACGHRSPAEALAGAVGPGELQQLSAAVRAWDDNAQRVGDSLSMLSQHELPTQAPDLVALQAEAAHAARSVVQLQERSAVVRTLVEQASREVEELEARSQAVVAAQSDADLAHRVAQVVSGDNDQRISLEAWVLAAYLRQVVEHANVHLLQMSNGRYALAVATEAADQRARHGLDLVVADAFTGTERPTRTLSGGESFQASLALALGLGDVVCHGRAGLHIDAMFIDEGFGTLDPKSVDQAVSVLDGLRSTGAMIGLITHVATVKEALPVAIEVGPSSEHGGSTVRQVA